MTDAITLARRETESPETLAILSGPEEIRSFEITCDEDQEVAADVLRDVKARYKAVEERRKSITQPLNTALREVNKLFKPLTTALLESERMLKGKIADYQREKIERNTRRLEEAAQAETWTEAQEALAETETHTSPKGVNVRHVWKPRVVDPTKVPRQYLMVDVGKLEALAKGAKSEPAAIPGVRWEQKDIVTSRA